MAHQYIEQIPEDIKDAVFGNVGSKLVFRIGTEDGVFLEKEFEPNFTAQDMTKLTVGNCYIRLLVNGQPTAPFSMNIPWSRLSSVPKDEEVARQIIEYSQKTYGTPIEQVEREANTRSGLDESKEEKQESPKRDKPALPF